jgi:hypothetical protein
MTLADLAQREWQRRAIPITRACEHCTCGRGAPDARVCGHPDALGLDPTRARAPGGACGPDARLMTFAL